MNRVVLISLFALGLASGLFAQTSGQVKPAPAPAAVANSVPLPAPLPDEKTLTIAEQPATAQNPNPGPSGDITIWDFVKMVVILALVIGMILGFLWFMKRLSTTGQDTDSPIKVLHTQTLGGNKNLQVVDVAGQILLMSNSEGGLRLVKDLTDTEAADAFRLAASQGKTGVKNGFGDMVASLMGAKPKIRPDIGQPAENSSDFLKKQRERLKNL